MTAATAAGGDNLDGMIALTERLQAMIAREAEMLASDAVAILSRHQEEKHALVALYGREMARLKADPAALAQADPARRARLREATGQFHALVAEQSRRIGAMKSVSERMIKAVGDEVARRNRPVRGYDDKAMLRSTAAGAMAARPTSIALNQII